MTSKKHKNPSEHDVIRQQRMVPRTEAVIAVEQVCDQPEEVRATLRRMDDRVARGDEGVWDPEDLAQIGDLAGWEVQDESFFHTFSGARVWEADFGTWAAQLPGKAPIHVMSREAAMFLIEEMIDAIEAAG